MPAWIPAIWAVVGLQLLIVRYFSLLGPPSFDSLLKPSIFLAHSNPDLLHELGRLLAWANLAVAIGLWAQLRRYRRLPVRFDPRKLACVATALALLLAPSAAIKLGHMMSRAFAENCIIWIGPALQHEGDGFYEVLIPRPSRLVNPWPPLDR